MLISTNVGVSIPNQPMVQLLGSPNYTIFYQGKSVASSQVSRYLDERELLLPTGEVYKRPNSAIGLIKREHAWIYPQLTEVKTTAKVSFDYKQKDVYLSKPYKPAYPLDIPGSLIDYGIDNNECSLGQDTDIKDHEARYNSLHEYLTRQKITDYNITLFGVSRGAAATFSALAENKSKYQNIKLCILEAPPPSLLHVFKYLTGSVLARPVYFFARKLGFLGKKHKSDNSKQALGHVDAFPDNIPLVVVSSEKDKLVPINSAIELALRVAVKRQKASVSTPVYFIKLNNADHNDYATDKEDAQRYSQIIHAIYRKHNLPFDKDLADKGESELNNCNLLSHQSLDAQRQYWENKSDKKNIRHKALEELLSSTNDDKIKLLETARFMPLFATHRSPINRVLPPRLITIPTASQVKIENVIESRAKILLSR